MNALRSGFILASIRLGPKWPTDGPEMSYLLGPKWLGPNRVCNHSELLGQFRESDEFRMES